MIFRKRLLRMAEQLCWACSDGRCGTTPKDDTCACCRRNHTMK